MGVGVTGRSTLASNCFCTTLDDARDPLRRKWGTNGGIWSCGSQRRAQAEGKGAGAIPTAVCAHALRAHEPGWG